MQKRIFLYLLFFSLAFWVSHNNQRTEYGSRDNHFEEYQQGVITHTIQGPLAYRVLMPYTIDVLEKITSGISGKLLALYLNIVLVFFAQLAFYVYLKNFFPDSWSLVGTMWMALCILMGFTSFMGVHVYESTDVFNLIALSMGLHLLFRKSWIALALVLFIGMLNRETPAFLLIPVFLLWMKEKFAFGYVLLCMASVLVPYFGLKLLVHPPDPSWFITVYLSENIPFLEPRMLRVVMFGTLKFLLFVGPAALMAIAAFRKAPDFLKVNMYWVPVFIVVHFIVGHVEEYRVWMPLFLVLIPLSLEALKKFQDKPQVNRLP